MEQGRTGLTRVSLTHQCSAASDVGGHVPVATDVLLFEGYSMGLEQPLNVFWSKNMNGPTTAHVKEFSIIVNGSEKKVGTEALTFDQVVGLAFPNPPPTPPGHVVVYTITFKNAGGDKKEGTLVEGGTLTVKNGTSINVTRTTKS